jgi:thiol-disulfide isomerase/thioredoxin
VIRAAAACCLAAAALLAGVAAAAAPGDAATALFAATFSTPAGAPATLAADRGRPLLVNFWARWCTPCRSEIPELLRLQREHPGILVVGIDLDEEPAAVREFATAYEMSYRVLITRGDGIDLLRALGNPAASLPFTLAIDARGSVVGRRLGVLRREDAERLLGALR